MQKIVAAVVIAASMFMAGMWFQRGLAIHSTEPLKKAAQTIQRIIQDPLVERSIFYIAGITAGIFVGMRIERRKSKDKSKS